ncbi:MAG TPA: uroporphyrinogen-III synthase [Ignavibacteriaceae bacterium]|nr:uroporphyrinogen-III synthase [Ignavibacteriaceae bacterium]
MIFEEMTDKKQIKKNKIIDAASMLFAQKNYHEVMMDDVARIASLAKGTLYNYFKSKEELYYSIMRIRMAELIELLKVNNNSLHDFTENLFSYMKKNEDFFLMYQKEKLKADNFLCNQLKDLSSELKKIPQEILLKGKEENKIKDLDEDFVADVIIGTVFSSVKRSIEKKQSSSETICEVDKLNEFINSAVEKSSSNQHLKDLKVVITRTAEQSNDAARMLRNLGADVLVFPVLAIVPPDDWSGFDEVVQNGLSSYDYVIFSSTHSVSKFSERCQELNILPDYDNLKVIAIGNKTAAQCEKENIPVHLIPQKFSGNGVVEELLKYDLSNKKVFIPRSAIGREELPESLAKSGAIVKTASVYNISTPPQEIIECGLNKLNGFNPELFIFTSPSTFENYLKIMQIEEPAKYFSKYTVAALGPTTKASIIQKGVDVNIMPDEYTMEGLINAIIKYYKNKMESF